MDEVGNPLGFQVAPHRGDRGREVVNLIGSQVRLWRTDFAESKIQASRLSNQRFEAPRLVNIIIRLLVYLAKTYQEYINIREMNVYSATPLQIPKTKLYVIYTGNTPVKKNVVTLSEEFFGGEQIDVDVRVHVLTDGKHGDIIYQYISFAKVFDAQIKQYGRTQQVIIETLRICKDRDLLKKYLTGGAAP